MEDRLRFFFVLPLKEIVLRRVVICLWNEPDALNEMFNSVFVIHGEVGGIPATVESKVKDKVLKLKLPNSLEKQLLHIIAPIGLQIEEWKEFHDKYLERRPSWKKNLEKHSLDSRVKFDASIFKKLCWTTAGAVDYLKTAEELVRCEMLDSVSRYQLASLYCLEDCIPIFWEELPEEIKRNFYDWGKLLGPYTKLQYCWPFILRGELSKYNHPYSSFYDEIFHYSLGAGNKAAAQYFFQKLTPEEKEASLVGSTAGAALDQYLTYSFPVPKHSDVVCYVLSQMNREQQMESFKFKSIPKLLSFMVWPCQDIFLKNARLLWAFFPTGEYENLMPTMGLYYTKYLGTIYYVKCFQEFFIHSPVEFKKFWVDQECISCQFFDAFFCSKDSETIQVIFRNVSAADRLRLVFSANMLRIFLRFIDGPEQHVVEVILREATLSEEDRERLRDAFMESRTKRIDGYRPKANRFLQLLDGIDASSQRKRFLEDENPDKAKKLRSDE